MIKDRVSRVILMNTRMDISKLLVTPVYDRDSLNREILVAKMIDWISQRTIYLNELHTIRATVRDILCEPVEHDLHEFPPKLESVDRLFWNAFTSQNRRALIQMALTYVGVNKKNPVDLFSQDGWQHLNNTIDSFCKEVIFDIPKELELTSLLWAKKTVAGLFMNFLTDDYLSAYDLKKLHNAMQVLMKKEGIIPLMSTEKMELSTEFSVLDALSYFLFKTLPLRSLIELPDILMKILGVDEKILWQVLGPEEFQPIQEIFSKMRLGDRSFNEKRYPPVGFFLRLKKILMW